MLSSIKKIIKSTLFFLGYKIVGINKGGTVRGYNVDYLKKLCDPKTVIDIGVGYGTEGLYEAYEQAFFIMIEPLKEFRTHLEQKYQTVDKEIYSYAVGASDGQAKINVDLSNLQHSGVLNRIYDKTDKIECRDIPIKKLDNLLNNNLQQPVLLKIDTEGHELDVILGADLVLQKCEYVLVELSVTERFEGSYSFYEFIKAMNDRGFSLFDIMSQHFIGDVGTKYIDAVFINNSYKNLNQD